MRDLTKEETDFLEWLMEHKAQKRNGAYYYFTICVKGKRKHYKRSRVIMQLHLGKKLKIWEHVHHKDRNKENDSIENLEVIDISLHTSLHHAGRRYGIKS